MIIPTLARLLVREHLYKPLPETVLVLGRQTIAMSREETLALFEDEGYAVPPDLLDSTPVTHDTLTRQAQGHSEFVSDEYFFRLLGVTEVVSLDVSDYEGAAIVHDFNEPVPADLYGSADFIVDGGTFDHLIALRTALENVAALLKPGGRIFQWNAASNFTGIAYLSIGPDLFHDWYLINGFADCKVYIAEGATPGQRDNWEFFHFTGEEATGYSPSPNAQMVIVIAEKGLESVGDRIPVQGQYRDEKMWAEYRDARRRVAHSERPVWVGVKSDASVSVRKSPTFGEKVRWKLRPITRHATPLAKAFSNRRMVQATRRAKAGYDYVGRI